VKQQEEECNYEQYILVALKVHPTSSEETVETEHHLAPQYFLHMRTVTYVHHKLYAD